MSRFVLGNCIDVMARIPDNAIDFILTDPPYLVGFRDRQGRTIAGDKTDEWLQPACNEMYRVLKKDALMVSFYGWNRVDRFMAAWKNAGFSVVGHLVFTKNYTSKAAYVGYRHECAYVLAKGRPALPQKPLVQQQGRNGQLRISFGSAKHPDCRGITVDELQKIQFDRLDFTNFYEDLMNNQKIPDSGVLTQKVKEQIADQLKQAGQ
ncbi:DNA methyltransferase [Escherichia coli]|uniref:DNA methyltransferase n=1 Tax=Escherichia coli TaxID=562 RepID=UPI003B5BBF34